MSCNRENVTWQSEDGTWSIGFFDYWETGDPFSEDFDYEWDVEYDTSRFNFASTGHATRDKARDAWGGANPGGSVIYEWRESDRAVIETYERMAAEWIEQEREAAKRDRPYIVNQFRY